MSKLTLEQLKSRTWPTLQKAEADFKRSKLPTSASHYHLGQTESGTSWTVLDGPPKFGGLIEGGNANPARKKSGKAGPKETAARVQRAASSEAKKAPAPKKAAEPKKAAATTAAADDAKPTPTPETFSQAMREALRKPATTEKPTPEPTPPPAQETATTDTGEQAQPAADAGIDWSLPLPHDGKPYTIALREGVGFPAHATHTWAIQISREQRGPVDVLDKDGNLVGTCDFSKLRGGAKRAAAADGSSTPTRRAPANGKPSDMESKLIKLATRKQGVTRADIAREVSDRKLAWTTMIKKLERFGYRYSTTDAPEGSGSRTVYHLEKLATP